MSTERGKYIGLTESGARIWDMLETPRTAEFLCDQLCREYDITPELCRAQVDSFLLDMGKQGALDAAAG